MNKFRNTVASAIAILTLLAAVYVGVWVMFIGGIVQGIEGIKANPVDSMDIAFGVARVMFAGFVGYVIMIVGLGIAGVVRVKRKFGRK